MYERGDILSVTSFFSVLIHAIIILGVTFQFPDVMNRPNIDNNLEIVLLNASNMIRDEEAETISVEDNMGGGENEVEASTPLEFKPTSADPIESIQLKAKNETVTQVATDELITASTAGISLPAQTVVPDSSLQTPTQESGESLLTTKTNRQLERERLIARLKQQQEEYQKRPKKAFLSPSTKAEGSARYLLNWKNKIQRTGNENLPQKIRDEKLVGIVIISVEINPNGTIAKIVVNEPSRHKLLNDYAQQILRQASPFDPFPDEEYFNRHDILVITRSFEFDSRLGFQTNAID